MTPADKARRSGLLPEGLVGRTAAAATLLAVALVAIFVLLLLSIVSFRHSSSVARHSQQVIASASSLETQVINLETGLRGFVITDDPKTLAPWRAARRDYPPSMRHLLDLVSDNPEQKARAQRLKASIDSYVRTFSLPLVSFMRRNPAAARLVVAAGAGEKQIDAIRGQFGAFITSERRLASARDDSARSTGTVTLAFASLSLGLTLVLVLLYAAFLARSVVRPVRSAARAAGEVAGGELSTRLPAEGPGEVGALADAFNTMAASLEHSRNELEEQYRRLQESEQLKTELVSNVSHELRTPLASILGFAEVMLRREIPEENRRRYLELIRAEAARLAELLNDLLDLQRAEEGRIELAARELDLKELLSTQVVLYSAQSTVHSVEVELPDEPLVVEADRDRLAQVVGNLLSNAIKYSPSGGRVLVRAQRRGEWIRIGVIDNGIGIPPDQQERLFTKFFRGDAGRRLGIGGTGLGLVLARQIVEAHGGRIGFESVPDRGSTFWIDLPANGSARAPESPVEARRHG
jgi:signal transduction histidine kinase